MKLTKCFNILNGTIARGYYPFMACMGKCGASLIDPQWILTAAHCAESFEKKPQPIYIGSEIREKGWKTTHEKIIKHPNYRRNVREVGVVHDIALIRLKEPAPTFHATTIKYAKNRALTAYNRFDATMIGWGYTESLFPFQSKKLREGIITMANNLPFSFCNTAGKLCSGIISADDGVHMSPGDSGGPLFLKADGEYIQIGIITVLWYNPLNFYINEFTDVAFYANWIQKVINKSK